MNALEINIELTKYLKYLCIYVVKIDYVRHLYEKN